MGSIKSIYSNIKDSIIWKIINLYSEMTRTKYGALSNTSINLDIVERIHIQNHLEPSVTDKTLTWNSTRLDFIKKISVPNPVKIVGYIKCYTLNSPRPIKIPKNFIRCNCQKIFGWIRRPETILEIRQSPDFSKWSTSFSKNLLTTKRRLTEW